MFKMIKTLFCSIFVRQQKNKSIQRQKKMKNLYLLGKGFYIYHENIKPENFIKWLKKYYPQCFKDNDSILDKYEKESFNVFIEDIYNSHDTFKNYDVLIRYFRKWYVQEHGIFYFAKAERTFITLIESHLLQILYRVQDEEIIKINSKEQVVQLITSPEDYKNNWFIGVDKNGELEKNIANHLISAADTKLAHYKLINDDKSKNKIFIDLLRKYNITNYIQSDFKSVTTIPNDSITIQRLDRYEQFDEFASSAESVFKQFIYKTPKAKRFDDLFCLNVWNDKNHPQNNVTYVNVGFGSRFLTISHNSKGFTSTTEAGASLCFYRMETGHISISLYPAKTEHRKPMEDAILLINGIEPSKLSKKKRLRSYWNDLIAYMECTSIDGNPSFCQKRRIEWLRYKKHLIVNNVYQPTKMQVFWRKVIEIFITVGLSGFVFYFIQFAYNRLYPDNTQTQNKDEIVLHIDSLHDAIKESADSISSKLIHTKNTSDKN